MLEPRDASPARSRNADEDAPLDVVVGGDPRRAALLGVAGGGAGGDDDALGSESVHGARARHARG